MNNHTPEAKPSIKPHVVSFVKKDTGHIETHTLITEPPPDEWGFLLSKNSDVLFCVPKGPCRFHRFMQRILLGIYWKKLPLQSTTIK